MDNKAEILALLALKKSGAVDVSQAVAAKTAAQAAQAAAEEAQEGAEAAQAAAEAAAAVFVVDDAMDDTSENPVQNKVIAGELGDLKSHVSATEIVVQTDSQPIVQIADGSANNAKSYDVQITPAQDLHGYDHPWPAGGGKNLWNGKFVDSSFNETDSYSGNYPGNNAMPITVGETYTASINGVTEGIRYAFLDSSKNQIGSMTNADTTIAAPSDAVYLRWRIRAEATENGKYQIEKGSTATAWTPYSNICPISGWTGAEVTRRGKNLFNPNDLVLDTYYTINSDGSITVAKSDTRGWNALDAIPIRAGTYTFSQTGATNGATIAYCFASEEYSTNYYLTTGTPSRVVTVAADDYFKIKIGTSASAYPVTIKFQIEPGSTATPYEPYSGADYSIDWSSTAGTIYGANLHVNEDGSGTLTVDSVALTFDNSAWQFSSTFFYKQVLDTNIAVNNYYITENGVKMYLNGTNGQARAYLADNAFLTSESDVGALLNGYKLIYSLATPQTYTLTAPQIALLLGTNNIWADAGNMAVEYIADTKLYIQTLTGHPDEDMTADSNITSGSFFMVGNTLYLATANIANGSTVIPGTNCTQMSLAAALNSINA